MLRYYVNIHTTCILHIFVLILLLVFVILVLAIQAYYFLLKFIIDTPLTMHKIGRYAFT